MEHMALKCIDLHLMGVNLLLHVVTMSLCFQCRYSFLEHVFKKMWFVECKWVFRLVLIICKITHRGGPKVGLGGAYGS
jgi:hypothetical protein